MEKCMKIRQVGRREGEKEGGREKEGANDKCERVNGQKLHEPGKLYTAAYD